MSVPFQTNIPLSCGNATAIRFSKSPPFALPSDRSPPHFQMEMARMTSEKRTFAALASCSVPITMRIAQDSNCA